MILRQVGGRRLTPRGLLLPLAIVAVAANRYLHGIPTLDNDTIFVAGFVVIGLALGVASALATDVQPGSDGVPVATAGAAAVVLWVIGTGSRLGFGLYATNGGGHTIAMVSRDLAITAQAWAPALVLMAFAEVIARSAVLGLRALAVARDP